MGLSGNELGAELGAIYRAGRQRLPAVADAYADVITPYGTGYRCARGGGLGNDPGGKFDTLLEKMDNAMTDTEAVMRAVGQRLVWAATDFEMTDGDAQSRFDGIKQQVDSEVAAGEENE